MTPLGKALLQLLGLAAAAGLGLLLGFLTYRVVPELIMTALGRS
jgi:hypothetical protein